MDAISPWLTPALIIGLFTWLRRDQRDLRLELNERFKEVNKRVSDEVKQVRAELGEDIKQVKAELGEDIKTLTNEMHQRFDQVNRELGENRERMAKLEGSLEGFLAGRRDRDAA